MSCDNYLSDAKFALSRRDSVGSGSPHSSKGSPRRWAAKADEIAAAAAAVAGPVVAAAVAADGGEAVAVMAVQGSEKLCELARNLQGGASRPKSCLIQFSSGAKKSKKYRSHHIPNQILDRKDNFSVFQFCETFWVSWCNLLFLY